MPISQAEPAAPRKRGRPRTSAAPGAVQAVQPSMSQLAVQRKDNLDAFKQIGVAVSIFLKNYADAGAIAVHGDGLTTALAKQGDTNEKLGKILDYFGVIGPWSEVMTAALPLLLQIMVNHNQVPADAVHQFGVVPPDLLENKIKLEIQQQRLAMEQALKEQEQQLQDMHIEITAYTPPNGIREHASAQTG